MARRLGKLFQTDLELNPLGNYVVAAMRNSSGFQIWWPQTRRWDLTCVLLISAAIMWVATFLAILRRCRKKPEREIISLDKMTLCNLAKNAYSGDNCQIVMNILKTNVIDVNRQMMLTGLSLFLCACLSGDFRLVRYLLTHKSGDPKQKSRDGDGALYLATYDVINSPHPNVRLLKHLISAGCDVNEQNAKGYTCLHRAASRGHIPIIRCLLDHGADPYITNQSGIYPLDSAINAGHVDAANLLKIKLEEKHGWDLLDPHTPPHIRLGLQTPGKLHLLESTIPTRLRTIRQPLTK